MRLGSRGPRADPGGATLVRAPGSGPVDLGETRLSARPELARTGAGATDDAAARTLARSGPPPGLAARGEQDLLRSELAETVGSPGVRDPEGGGEGAGVAASFGRYVILERLGAGGMGVVYAAYDPELDRRIALKVVDADPRVAAAEVGGLAWLMREAQAMARLSHPNVVHVYDVGVLGDRLYIAMELVDGGTLSAWLGSDRGWREVVAIFIEAGRGLAAAHAAGLVHRDFKPDNVLIGLDGRPRVTDFGLARAASLAESEVTAPIGASASASVLASKITQAGALLGTPAYMAPEQFTGAPVDARSDLFALCVALYEGLYGERPFSGDTLAALQDAVLGGEVREPPVGRKVPKRIRRALLRGLRVDPDARFADVDALLRELDRDPSRALWRVGGALGIAALAGLAAAGWWRERDQASALCRGGADRVAGLWSGARQAALAEVFVASSAPAAADTWAAVSRVIDADLAGWAAMHRDTCEATRVRGVQSEALLDLRMRCLEGHLHEVDALAEVFAGGDPEVVSRSFEAIGEVTPLSRCADVDALEGQLARPSDRATAGAVDRLRRGLIEGEALARSGRYDAAWRRIDAIRAEAEAVDYPPLLAEVLLARGQIEGEREEPAVGRESLIAALTIARAHGHDEVSRDASIELVGLVGVDLGKLDEGELWARLAGAELSRTRTPIAEARLLERRGDLRWGQGRYDEALADHEASVEQTRALFGEEHPATAHANIRLGRSLWARGEYERGRQHLARGREALEAVLGREHPAVAAALRQEGNVYWVTGDLAKALEIYERALAIAEGHGMSAEAAKILNNIAATHGKLGRMDAARVSFERALGMYERLHPGEESDASLVAIENLVADYMGTDDPAAWERARVLIERAAAFRDRTLPAGHPERARSMILRGNYALRVGAPEEALGFFEEALVLREAAAEVHPILRGRALEGLARALVAGGRERARAATTAAAAAVIFREAGVYGAAELEALDGWRRAEGLVGEGEGSPASTDEVGARRP